MRITEGAANTRADTLADGADVSAELVRRRTRLVGAMTFVLAVGLPTSALLNSLSEEAGRQPGAIDYIFLAILAAVAVLFFVFIVPWALRGQADLARPTRTGLILRILAWLSAPVFWTMAPIILGSAGAYLGYEASRRRTDARRCAAIAAMVIGLAAAVITIPVYFSTWS